MGQQLTQSNVSFTPGTECRPIPGNPSVEFQLAFFRQLHYCGCSGDNLGKRCNIKNGLFGHGQLPGLNGTISEGPAVNDSFRCSCKYNCAGDLALTQFFFDNVPDRFQLLCELFY